MSAAVSRSQEQPEPIVLVPDIYEFLEEENKYQLNALTNFLLEKHGFRSLYKEPLPQGIDACDVLKVNVHNKSGLFRSRLFVTLEDCQGRVVFTSKTGSSREKEFKTGYHEALREAFQSVAAAREEILSGTEAVASNPTPDVDKGTQTRGEELPRYRLGEQIFIMEKTGTGFDILEDGAGEKFARLLQSGNKESYIFLSEDRQGTAYFNATGGLVVEFPDPKTGELKTLVFELL